MTESAYYKFKRPNTLTMLSRFWNEIYGRFQGRVHYTTELRPKINQVAFQRRINVDRVISLIGVGEWLAQDSMLLKAKRGVLSCTRRGMTCVQDALTRNTPTISAMAVRGSQFVLNGMNLMLLQIGAAVKSFYPNCQSTESTMVVTTHQRIVDGLPRNSKIATNPNITYGLSFKEGDLRKLAGPIILVLQAVRCTTGLTIGLLSALLRSQEKKANSYGRCFRYRDCFGNGQARDTCASHKRVSQCCQPGESPGTLPKAVSLSSQFDRKTDCFDGGAMLLGLICPSCRVRNTPEVGNLECHPLGLALVVSPTATFKAVCLTQTRHDGFVNKYQPDSQNVLGSSNGRTLEFSQSRNVGSNPAPRSTWQKPRRVLRLNQDSGRSQQYNGSRPDRTGLRKTPSSWLPANEINKDHPGFVLKDMKVKESPFLSRGL